MAATPAFLSLLDRISRVRPFELRHWWALVFLLALFVAIFLTAPVRCLRFSRAVNRLFRTISKRPLLCAVFPGLIALAAGTIFYGMHGSPDPAIHDEFSYLLAADTFVHGRLTNPPHPLWEFFESFHEIPKPTYASMYPPGQGLVLAAATFLTGNPWFGVWLSVIVLALILGWSLRGWFPDEWALIGALMGATLASFSYWLTSYWGGAVAAIGGALVLGAWPRLERRPALRESLLFAAGAVILANTRIYEGGVLVAVASAGLLWRLWRRPAAPFSVYLRLVILPIALVLATGSCWTMFYDWRVTGDPLLMPYMVNSRMYNFHRMFVWQHDKPEPSYHHEVMRKMYEDVYRDNRGNFQALREQVEPTVNQYMGSLALLVLFGIMQLARARRTRGLLIATLAVAIATSLFRYLRPHYVAPAMAGFIGLTLGALIYLRAWRISKRRAGYFVVTALIVTWFAVQWIMGLRLLYAAQPGWLFPAQRAQIEREMQQTGDRNLIFVRYDQTHDPNQEWVYNGSDLFDPPILWARDMGPDKNKELIRYCQGRKVWLLQPEKGPSLLRYPDRATAADSGP